MIYIDKIISSFCEEDFVENQQIYNSKKYICTKSKYTDKKGER